MSRWWFLLGDYFSLIGSSGIGATGRPKPKLPGRN
jgi:hypothetical protein